MSCLSPVLAHKVKLSYRRNARFKARCFYNEQWSNSSVGKIVGRLGFERVHTNKGNALIWNEKLVEKLKTDLRYTTAFTPIEIEDKDTPAHLEKGSLPSQGSPDPDYLYHTNELEDSEHAWCN